jgi:RNA polymerase sigma-70 factor (family 1)
MTDSQLVKELKSGDIQAFNDLFRGYSQRLYAFGLKYLKSQADAEELVQDVFLKIWRNREKLKEDRSFRSYLFTIAYHQIKEYFQYRGVFFDTEVNSDSSSDNSVEDSISYKSLLEQISSLLKKLPKKKQENFILSRFEVKRAKEIALAMGVSPKTVDNQVSEVIGFLRKNMNEGDLLTILFFYLFLQ